MNNWVTEENNPKTVGIDHCTAIDMVKMINEEDKLVSAAVACELERIAALIEDSAERIRNGGRLIYIGAGTSGRLAAIDAGECPVTYGVPEEMVQAVIPGGNNAFSKISIENEDDEEAGARDIGQLKTGKNDIVVGISASGRTPYVLGGLREARRNGALTACICSNLNTPMAEITDHPIEPVTGPEVIQGSTRMKAGTAQKMVLNMLSTGIMVRLGYVYQNIMCGVQANNEKLYSRAVQMVVQITSVEEEKARKVLEQCGYDVNHALSLLDGGKI